MNTATVALINVIKWDRTRDTKIVGLRSPNGSLLPVTLKRLVCKGAAASTAPFDRVARFIVCSKGVLRLVPRFSLLLLLILSKFLRS